MANIAGQQVKFSSTQNLSLVLGNSGTSLSNPSTIFFTNDQYTKDQKIILNGIDYSGVKTILEGSESGKINVDGLEISVHGWDDKANKSEAISNIELTPEYVLRVKKVNDSSYTDLADFANIAITGSWNDLKNIPTLDYIPNDLKGVANGVATLDNNGLIPSSQLPSYVDDIIDVLGCYEYGGELYLNEDRTGQISITGSPGTKYLALNYTTPMASNIGIYVAVEDLNHNLRWQREPGETGKIYIETSTGKLYRFSANSPYEAVEIISNPGTTDVIVEGTTNKFVTVLEKNSWNGKVGSSSTSTNEHVAIFDGDTGKVIKDSGFILKQNVETTSKLTDLAVTLYTYHYDQKDLAKGGNNYEYEPENTDAVIKKIITDERGHIRSIEGVSLNVSNVTNAQSVNNKVNSWSSTVTNDKYPSEKLVKDSLDTKADKATTLAGYGILDVTINNGQISIGGTSITPYVKPSGGIPRTDLSSDALKLTQFIQGFKPTSNIENYIGKIVVVQDRFKPSIYNKYIVVDAPVYGDENAVELIPVDSSYLKDITIENGKISSTPATTDNSNNIADTAFVKAAISSALTWE